VGAVFPALACIVSALVAERRRATPTRLIGDVK
jgi:hypothetical protein